MPGKILFPSMIELPPLTFYRWLKWEIHKKIQPKVHPLIVKQSIRG